MAELAAAGAWRSCTRPQSRSWRPGPHPAKRPAKRPTKRRLPVQARAWGRAKHCRLALSGGLSLSTSGQSQSPDFTSSHMRYSSLPIEPLFCIFLVGYSILLNFFRSLSYFNLSYPTSLTYYPFLFHPNFTRSIKFTWKI